MWQQDKWQTILCLASLIKDYVNLARKTGLNLKCCINVPEKLRQHGSSQTLQHLNNSPLMDAFLLCVMTFHAVVVFALAISKFSLCAVTSLCPCLGLSSKEPDI